MTKTDMLSRTIVIAVTILNAGCPYSTVGPEKEKKTTQFRNQEKHATIAGQRAPALHSCQRIVRSGDYRIDSDLKGAQLPISAVQKADAPPSRACIEIAASNVTLDCEGHSLKSVTSRGNSVGIFLAGRPKAWLSNVHIENCTVSEFRHGIYGEYVKNSSIVDSKIKRNHHVGLYLYGASNTKVARNTAEGNGPDGILIHRGEKVTVANNHALRNRMRGITIDNRSRDCTIKNNESHDHGVLGFGIYQSRNTKLVGNEAHHNGYHGFATLHTAYAASLKKNVSHDNDKCGFFLLNTADNAFKGNLARDNDFDGIVVLEQTHDSVFVGNTLRNNGRFGVMLVEMAARDKANNELVGNAFSGNGFGDRGTVPGPSVNRCAYTGFAPGGPCDPLFKRPGT